MKVVVHFNKEQTMTINALKYEVGPGVVRVLEELEENSSFIASLNKTKEYVFSLNNVLYLEVSED